MERVGEGQGKMESYFSTGQSPQRAVAPTEEEGEDFTAVPHSPDSADQTARLYKTSVNYLRNYLLLHHSDVLPIRLALQFYSHREKSRVSATWNGLSNHFQTTGFHDLLLYCFHATDLCYPTHLPYYFYHPVCVLANKCHVLWPHNRHLGTDSNLNIIHTEHKSGACGPVTYTKG
jgi:hypothetical protein